MMLQVTMSIVVLKNYAYLGNDSNNFKVYDAIGTPSNDSLNTNGKVAFF